MRSGGTPRRSLTICAKAVSLPWPIDVEPAKSETEPSGLTRSSRGVGIDRGVGPARHLDGVGDAEPAGACRARAPRRAASRSPARSARASARSMLALELAAVVGEDEAGLERHRRGRDEVAAAQLDRVDPELARGHVDHALDRVRRLRPAGAAVGPGRRGVGEHAGGLDVDGGRGVHAGQRRRRCWCRAPRCAA